MHHAACYHLQPLQNLVIIVATDPFAAQYAANKPVACMMICKCSFAQVLPLFICILPHYIPHIQLLQTVETY